MPDPRTSIGKFGRLVGQWLVQKDGEHHVAPAETLIEVIDEDPATGLIHGIVMNDPLRGAFIQINIQELTEISTLEALAEQAE